MLRSLARRRGFLSFWRTADDVSAGAVTPREEVVRFDLKKAAAVVGLIGGFWLLVTAATAVLDRRYAQRDDVAAIRSDIRVLRCQLVQDCKP